MRSSREEVLAAVGRATLDAPRVPRPSLVPGAPPGPDTVGLFADRVADYLAMVEHCRTDELGPRVRATVDGLSVVVPDGLSVDVPGARRDSALSAPELNSIDAVVTDATVGIAETGTIVLDHGPGQGRRALTLVPDFHLCIIRAAQVVADVPDALVLLDPSRPTTWVSGPSATSDIELSRVEGVHGPRRLHVIIVTT
jgi:L-lactate dehydrogenase complex protein LldG